jgi:recombination protein U
MKSSYANKGMNFEYMIEQANAFYFQNGIAAILKIPTSFKVVRRFNPRTTKSEIVSCYPEKKSTVDFIGQAGDKPIHFEAKSTSNKTSFPLNNIADHQLQWLETVDKLGGKAFFLIEIVKQRKIYRITYKQLQDFKASNKRKSIPFSFFENECFEVDINKFLILDYLKGL